MVVFDPGKKVFLELVEIPWCTEGEFQAEIFGLFAEVVYVEHKFPDEHVRTLVIANEGKPSVDVRHHILQSGDLPEIQNAGTAADRGGGCRVDAVLQSRTTAQIMADAGFAEHALFNCGKLFS